ncbi:hypothetical protein [Subtercola vilae]|uniref:Uncharacterized protein n=1 Tax=Subtercola vilae TaxID=2056433 RepID=A0A4T2BZD3_9MICO|nr:hypothetical protein [Subtercola vilae]TIH37373.1 hypothetical protein D4765_08165 [Subtercola vilae]
MNDARKQQVEERHIATLSAFVLRARRVEAHSLAVDKALLQKLWRMEVTYQFVAAENQGYLIQVLPPEEQVESAAARVRPLILQEDSVHYIKVLNALGYFAKDSGDEKLRNALAAIRSDWNRIQPKGKNILGASTQIEDADGNKSEFLSDTELAFAYIYGDIVHNDVDRLAATKMHGVKERFKAAAPIVGFIMVLTIATLNVTRNMRTTGLLELPEELFTEDVVVSETVFRNKARAWSAPVGTPLHEEFGGERESVDSATSPSDAWQEQKASGEPTL